MAKWWDIGSQKLGQYCCLGAREYIKVFTELIHLTNSPRSAWFWSLLQHHYFTNITLTDQNCIQLNTTLQYTVVHCTVLHHCTKAGVGEVVLSNCVQLPVTSVGSRLPTALHCTALHCTLVHCTALHCTLVYCTALHWTALFCTVIIINRPGVAGAVL